MTPLVWVIVLNWNGWEDTLRCLETLRAQEYQAIHLLVIDNASTDDSVRRLREAAPDVDILELSENLGFAGGMNRGIESALANHADYVLLLNNDTEVQSQAIARLVSAAEGDSRIGLAVPTIVDKRGVWYAGGSLSRWTGTVRHGTRIPSDHQDVTFASGCCLLVRRALLEDLGGLDASYFLYFEDADFSMQASRAGWRILYLPNARILHLGGASTGSQARKAPSLDYYDVRNGLHFIARNLHGIERVSALLYFWLVRLPRKIVRILCFSNVRRESLQAVLDGLQDAICGRTGKR